MYQGKFQSDPTPVETPAADVVRAPSTPRRRKPQPKRRGPTKGSLIFYAAYLGVILLFFIGLTVAMISLRSWLLNFQAAQPEVASQQVFTQLFSKPDWGKLYEMANPGNTNDRATAAFVEYMTQQIGDDQLTFVETSGGTNIMKYYVLHGRQVVAAFSMRPVDKDADVTQWQFDNVEFYYTYRCNQTYSILVQPGCVVTANGEKLDEGDIAKSITTLAEEYLPKGVQGYRMIEYRVSGLDEKPEVSVVDAKGNPVELSFSEEDKSFTQVLPEAPTITQDQYDVVLAATKAYAKFIIAGGTTDMRKYFDPSSDIYKAITGGMIIRQDYTKYVHGKESITDYYRYSDTVFSAKIKLITTVSSVKYGDKDVEIDDTFIFVKKNGKWIVHDKLNINIQEEVADVRLTFKDAEGNVISSKLVDAEGKVQVAPSISTPQGKTFLGWQEQIIDEEGNIGLVETIYTPDSNGNISFASRTADLEPMVLVPVFEDVEETA